jgi:hypothetical protein
MRKYEDAGYIVVCVSYYVYIVVCVGASLASPGFAGALLKLY